MSRKRRRQTPVSTTTPQQLPKTDARRVVAARASKALRSAELAKARLDLLKVYNEALPPLLPRHPYQPSRRGRYVKNSVPVSRWTSGKSVDLQTHKRRLPSLPELRRAPLSSKVRHQLQDGITALECERRRSRKEIMFALRRTGKAGRKNKRAKWTDKSYVRCK